MEKVVPKISFSESKHVEVPGIGRIYEGMKLVVKTRAELEAEYGGNFDNVPIKNIADPMKDISVPWTIKYHRYVEGKEFVLNDDIVKVIDALYKKLGTSILVGFQKRRDGKTVCLPLSIMKLAVEDKKEESRDVSIRINDGEKKKEIMEKMISMVNIDDMANAFKWSAETNSNAYSTNIDFKATAESYLREWALRKYEFFLMLGERLSVSIPLEHKLDEKMIMYQWRRTADRYEDNLRRDMMAFSFAEISSNSCSKDNPLNGKDKYFAVGLKVSKFFSRKYNSTNLDLSISKIMQNNNQKGSMYLSIDPLDYLTMSVNHNDWHSCQRINCGGWGNAAYSMMRDDVTMVAYICNDKVYKYGNEDSRFSMNSKRWRQLVILNKNNCSIAFNRDYPNGAVDDNMRESVRLFVEGIVSSYAKSGDTWNVFAPGGRFTNGVPFHGNGSCYHYNDPTNMVAYVPNTNTGKIKFEVGVSSIPCICCGKTKIESSGTPICSACRRKISPR